MDINLPQYSWRNIKRKKTKEISIGNIKIGGDNPIIVQTMTNTLTTDVKATLNQIKRCHKAGAELVRVSVPDKESSAALKEIVKKSPVPIIADIHFHYRRGIEAAEAGASCIRINPGTLMNKSHAKEMIKACKEMNLAIRLGCNSGSISEETILRNGGYITPDTMVDEAMTSLKIAEDLGFSNLKLSVKASDTILAIRSYELLASKCDYPLHLGITEAGSMTDATIKTSIGFGYLLMLGIGDTIRCSITDKPELEIPVCYKILKSLNLREYGVTIISCPSCARQEFDVIKISKEIEKYTKHIKENIAISILGCIVNGIGEAKRSDIGVTGAMSGRHLIYKYGKQKTTCKTEDLIQTVVGLIEEVRLEKK